MAETSNVFCADLDQTFLLMNMRYLAIQTIRMTFTMVCSSMEMVSRTIWTHVVNQRLMKGIWTTHLVSLVMIMELQRVPPHKIFPHHPNKRG